MHVVHVSAERSVRQTQLRRDLRHSHKCKESTACPLESSVALCLLLRETEHRNGDNDMQKPRVGRHPSLYLTAVTPSSGMFSYASNIGHFLGLIGIVSAAKLIPRDGSDLATYMSVSHLSVSELLEVTNFL